MLCLSDPYICVSMPWACRYEAGGLLATEDGSLSLLAGTCVGGGSVVNWSASFRTPQHVRREWATEFGLEVSLWALLECLCFLSMCCTQETVLREECLDAGVARRNVTHSQMRIPHSPSRVDHRATALLTAFVHASRTHSSMCGCTLFCFLLQSWQQFDSPEFDAALDAVCARVGVNADNTQHNIHNSALREGCAALGYPCEPIPRNASPPHACESACDSCAAG